MSLLRNSFFVILLAFIFHDLQAQQQPKKIKINEQSIVTDPGGGLLPYTIWQRLLMTGEYTLKRGNNDTLVLSRLSEKDKEQRELSIAAMPKPVKSKSFYDNEKMYKIKANDIYGNKINTRDLKGKIIVLNFWFINCPPCKMEIPHLNKLVADYKKDSGIVFLGIALDNTRDIADFLKTSPFNYTLIPNGRDLNNSSNITGFPTNVVIDKEGKVFFHTVGFAPNTVHWIRKSIEEIKAQPATSL